jgi:hypothetical protein
MFKQWIRIILAALGASHPTTVWALRWLDRWPEGAPPGATIGRPEKGANVTALPGGKMMVRVIRGRGLLATDAGGTSDPYVVVTFAGEQKKTWPKKKTVNPEWDERFDFAVSSDDRYNADVVFQCFDKDVMGSDDDLGRFVIPCARLPAGIAYRTWSTFEEETHTGEVEVEILLQEATVPGLQGIVPDGKKPRGSLIEQAEAKETRDRRRVEREESEKVAAWEKGFEEAARQRFNRASELQLRRQLRRDAKIAAGLDPALIGDSDPEDEEGDPEEAGGAVEGVGDGMATDETWHGTLNEDGSGAEAKDAVVGATGETRVSAVPSQLVGLDADVTAVSAAPLAVDEQGATPLHHAAGAGKEDKVSPLSPCRPHTSYALSESTRRAPVWFLSRGGSRYLRCWMRGRTLMLRTATA